MTPLSSTMKASLLAAIAATLYGFLGYLGTLFIQDKMSISCMLFWRFFIASLWMGAFCLKSKTRKQMHYYSKDILINLFFLGAIGYACSSAFFFLSAQYTGTGLAMVLFFSYPIMVGLLDWIINRNSLRPSHLSIFLFMIIGLVMLRDNSPETPDEFGILVGLLSAVCYGLYIIGSKKLTNKKLNSNLSTFFVCLSASFIFLVYSLSSHQFSFPKASWQSYLTLLTLGIFITAIPIQLILEALKSISSMRTSIISVLEPIVTVIVGVSLLHEVISQSQLLGAILILCTAMAAQFIRDF